MGISAALKLLKDDLPLVEEEIKNLTLSRSGLITEVATYVCQSGGKRLRPILLLLCSRLCGYTGPRSIRMAAIVEFLHAATLIHDDIIDNSSMRRGNPSANYRWGNGVSVIVGDFLYSTAVYYLVQDGDLEILDTMAKATVRLTEGEVLQLSFNKKLDISYQDYLDIISGKTAALIAACCRSGALLAAAPPAVVDKLSQFGQNLGLAFQLVDDALDFAADENILGKPVGNDLREGKVTYPILYTMARAATQDQEYIRRFFDTPKPTEEAVQAMRTLVSRYGAVDGTLIESRKYLDQALQILQSFPPSTAKDCILTLADYLTVRDH